MKVRSKTIILRLIQAKEQSLRNQKRRINNKYDNLGHFTGVLEGLNTELIELQQVKKEFQDEFRGRD